MSRLELVIMAGAESKKFLADITSQFDRIEKLCSKHLNSKGGKAALADDADEEESEDEEIDPPAKKGKKAAKFEDADEESDDEEESDESEDEEEEAPAKKTKGKKAAKFEDDDADEEESEEADDAEDEEEEALAKKTKGGKKAPKLTIDDVNDACMDRAGRSNRSEVLGLLKKHFKIKSVTELEPGDYEACIKLMNGKK